MRMLDQTASEDDIVAEDLFAFAYIIQMCGGGSITELHSSPGSYLVWISLQA